MPLLGHRQDACATEKKKHRLLEGKVIRGPRSEVQSPRLEGKRQFRIRRVCKKENIRAAGGEGYGDFA